MTAGKVALKTTLEQGVFHVGYLSLIYRHKNTGTMSGKPPKRIQNTRVRTLIVATIYLQLIQNRYMFRSFTVLHCSHQH